MGTRFLQNAGPARLWLADEPTGNLDSAQSAEIISLLKQRSREHGATLIVVTHEPEIAEQLDRIATLVDGEIETTTASVMTVTATPGAITESHIRWAKTADKEISDESVIIGQALANRLGLKLIDLMPEIEVQGMPVRVTGIIESDRSPAAAGAVFVTSDLSDKLGDSTSGTLFIKTMPGAARNVAKSLPVLINPYDEARVNIAPVLQPDSYRGALQDSVAISLLVLAVVASLAGLGAVVLVNVLSVTARVPEFGVRRAFGARRKNIVTLFIGECVSLGFIGAIVGLAVGFAAIMTVTAVAKWQPVFDPQLLIVPLAGAILFGTLGSIPPAIAAGRIEPADAVRA